MKTTTFVLAGLLLAQSAPRFDVASVKVNVTKGGTTRCDEPQGLTYLNITLGELVTAASRA